jgi:hypothetical protein
MYVSLLRFFHFLFGYVIIVAIAVCRSTFFICLRKNLPITVTYSGALSCTVANFSTCSLPPFSVCTFDLLPKNDDVVTFYRIYLHFPKHFLFTSPSSKPLFMYLTHVTSCFGTISSKNKFPALFMLLSHLTFSFYKF